LVYTHGAEKRVPRVAIQKKTRFNSENRRKEEEGGGKAFFSRNRRVRFARKTGRGEKKREGFPSVKRWRIEKRLSVQVLNEREGKRMRTLPYGKGESTAPVSGKNFLTPPILGKR